MRIIAKILRIFGALSLLLVMSNVALAGDWVAVKLRGGVFAFDGAQWQQLERGSVVPDERVIRTARDGRVQFRRDAETIDLSPDTQIRIYDRGSAKFTIVQEHFGDVAIEAEKRQIQHFAVQTQYLAAVVKGTRFSVHAGDGAAKVAVERGQVEVRDVARQLVVRVNPGQSAEAGRAQTEILRISGAGNLDAVAPFEGSALADNIVVDRSPAAIAEVASVINEVKSGGSGLRDVAPGLKVSNAGGNGNGNANSLSKVGGLLRGSVNSGSSAVTSVVSGKSSNSNAGGNGNGNANGLAKQTESTVSNVTSTVTETVGNTVESVVETVTGPGNSNGAGNSENSNAGGNGNGNANGHSKGGGVVSGVLGAVGGLL